MAEARLSVRVDNDVKRQAEEVFRQLGLTLSSGINAFLVKVVRDQGIPFELTLDNHDTSDARRFRADSLEQDAQHAVAESVASLEKKGVPVARYDVESKRPYYQMPDGSRDYAL